MDFPSGPCATRLQTGAACGKPIGFLTGTSEEKSGHDIRRCLLGGVTSISPETDPDLDFLPLPFDCFCDTGALGGVAAIRMCLFSPSPCVKWHRPSFSVYVNTMDFSILHFTRNTAPTVTGSSGRRARGTTASGSGDSSP